MIGYATTATPLLVRFPAIKAGLATVGYTLKNINGTEYAARSTAGVVDVGNGDYCTSVTIAAAWIGTVLWDTGDIEPLSVSEEVSILPLPLAASSYVAPDNAGIAAIQAVTDQFSFTMGMVDANATVDTSGIATAVWNEDISGISGLGLAGTVLNTSGAAGDPLSTIVPGSDPPITRGQAIDNLYIPDYDAPIIPVPAPPTPQYQRMTANVKELGITYATGDTFSITGIATQTANGSIISNAPLVCAIDANGSILDPSDGFAGVLVDKGATVLIECKRGSNPVVTYYSKQITISADATKDVADY